MQAKPWMKVSSPTITMDQQQVSRYVWLINLQFCLIRILLCPWYCSTKNGKQKHHFFPDIRSFPLEDDQCGASFAATFDAANVWTEAETCITKDIMKLRRKFQVHVFYRKNVPISQKQQPGTRNIHWWMRVSMGWFLILTWEMAGNHQTSIKKPVVFGEYRVPSSASGMWSCFPTPCGQTNWRGVHRWFGQSV